MSSPKQEIAERVLGFIRRHSLVSPPETLVVGVSGGPDSVCLLHLLVRLKDSLGIGLHVAHLDHALRGAESRADAEYVSELAHRLGIPATMGRRDVRDYRARHRLSLEEAARRVRYEYLAGVAADVGAGRIAVGHNADDQAETILMRLLRGAGALGLQGMQPLTAWGSLGGNRGLKVIRPILEVTRKEVEAYCQQHGLSPRQDSSNLSRSHLRNRVRHELGPLLESYNPRINQALLRTADTLAIESSFFEERVRDVWDEVVSEEGSGLLLRATEIRSLHPALQRHLLRQAARRVLGSLEDIEWKHVDRMARALKLPAGKRVVLPRGLTLYVEDAGYRVAVE